MEEYGHPGSSKHRQSDSERRATVRGPNEESSTIIEMEKYGPEQILDEIRKEREKAASKRTWGRVLIVLGAVTVIDSCSVFPIPLIGPPALIIGAALMLVGAGFLVRVPRLRETNEAMVIAMKHGNRLTVPRLALEMDITLEKAEKIIDKLVKNGVAEIDLEDRDSDGALTYKIKGI